MFPPPPPRQGLGPQFPCGAAEPPPQQPAWGSRDPRLWPQVTWPPPPEQGAGVSLELSTSVPPQTLTADTPPSAPQPHNPWVPVPGDGLPMTDGASLLVQSSQPVTFVKGKRPLSLQRLSLLLGMCRPHLE